MTYQRAHARYAGDATQTASAARLLTMLYDRLVLDLATAHNAMEGGDFAVTGERIAHASEILLELHSTLDVEIWPEGEALARLYIWMVGELMQAHVQQTPQRIADCHALVLPLRDAWREASMAGSGAA